ncbi:MAG: sigma-54-dependent Fis family transcriptional regulator [FCB group bacterium]|nr:sigma-54-dependent Fis family transcriptional regulator [FCB group bacterium]
MADRAIIYGDIISEKERQNIEKNYPSSKAKMSWEKEPSLCNNKKGSSLVFVDLDNPLFTSADFLISIATAGENTKVIGKSRNPKQEEAIRVAKFGVTELLTPHQCLQRLDNFLNQLEKEQTSQKNSKYSVNALIGSSSQTKEIRRTINLLADVDFPSALILGETGTGKSLVSKILHHTGVRADHNLVEVNCSAIPDELFETELFGHTQGAFTDAKNEKMGLFEYAQQGTLFLDEVGNLSPSAQAKLLKILEDKKLRKVGTVKEKDIDVRVITATNINLEKTIEQGKFREDLYFRLNLLTLEIPPLRERPVDIPEIVKHYLKFYSIIYGKPNIEIDEDALVEMKNHKWPGNVRELCNVIERAVLLTKKDIIKLRDIKTALKKDRLSVADRQQIVIDIPPNGLSLEKIEQNIVKQVLNMFNWNKTKTAKYLGISRPRLRRIMGSTEVEQNRRQR